MAARRADGEGFADSLFQQKEGFGAVTVALSVGFAASSPRGRAKLHILHHSLPLPLGEVAARRADGEDKIKGRAFELHPIC